MARGKEHWYNVKFWLVSEWKLYFTEILKKGVWKSWKVIWRDAMMHAKLFNVCRLPVASLLAWPMAQHLEVGNKIQFLSSGLAYNLEVLSWSVSKQSWFDCTASTLVRLVVKAFIWFCRLLEILNGLTLQCNFPGPPP